MSAVDMGLWGLAGLLLMVAVWNTLPRPPELNWEVYFKVVITSLIRGEVEAAEGGGDEWIRAGRAHAWFHAAARDLEAKLIDPETYTVKSPALEGELALVEVLSSLGTVQERLERTFLHGSSDAVLYDDPAFLGEEYDPRNAIGSEADWEAVAHWSDGLVEALRRRHEHVRWVVMGGTDAHVQALSGLLGSGRVVQITGEQVELVKGELEGMIQQRSDRLVLLVVGDGAGLAVRVMHASPGLRDRVLAVVGVGAGLGGETRRWLEAEFTHQSMDTELSRLTYWFHLAFVTPGVESVGEPGRPLADTRWPQPAVPESGRVSIEAIDLGVLPGPGLAYAPELLIKALVVTVTARLGTG